MASVTQSICRPKANCENKYLGRTLATPPAAATIARSGSRAQIGGGGGGTAQSKSGLRGKSKVLMVGMFRVLRGRGRNNGPPT